MSRLRRGHGYRDGRRSRRRTEGDQQGLFVVSVQDIGQAQGTGQIHFHRTAETGFRHGRTHQETQEGGRSAQSREIADNGGVRRYGTVVQGVLPCRYDRQHHRVQGGIGLYIQHDCRPQGYRGPAVGPSAGLSEKTQGPIPHYCAVFEIVINNAQIDSIELL